jgi:hypothetical protein
MLVNSSVTINSGTGLSGGGAVALGSSLTLNNTGVLGVTASGPLSATAGQNPVISLSGIVPIANGGTGISTGPTAAGQYLRSTGAGSWSAGSIVAGDLPSLSGTYVDLTSGQSIGGNKTFTGNATFNNTITGSISGNAATATTATTANNALALGGNAAASYSTTAQSDARYLQLTGGTLTGTLNLPVNGLVAGTNQLVISSGNVGIGTATPAAKLDVRGSLNLVATASGATGISVQTTDTGSVNTAINGLANGSGGTGVIGEADNGSAAAGVWGLSSGGVAGLFSGNVQITGSISKGGGSFKIDHPLDPANKYLYHSFVESPDMKNIYDGVAQLDAQGEAVVQLPDWFQALNKDFRYQLTCIGGFAPVYIAEEVSGNQFKIAGGKPGMKVSWMVTGIRQDAWANANRIPVVQEKPAEERGYYLHPSLYGAPAQKSLEWARHPEVMSQAQRTGPNAPQQ